MVDLAIQCWSLAFGALRRMPRLAWSAMILLPALQILATLIIIMAQASPTAGGDTGLSPQMRHQLALAHSATLAQTLFQVACNLGVAVLRAFVVAPLAVAVHRFVLLDEARDRFAIATTPREVRFALWILGVTLITIAGPFMLGVVAGIFAVVAGTAGKVVAIVLIFVSAVLAIIVLLRLALLFPAIALDRAAPARESRTLTYRHVWRIFLTGVLMSLPVIVAFAVVLALFVHGQAGNTLAAGGVAFLVFSAVVQVLVIAASAAMASLFYRRYAGSLAPPPAGVPV
jgi:hypothetical protein